ncbi:MAG: hypothetical protein AAGC72_08090 [Planctomycetota bacterium]
MGAGDLAAMGCDPSTAEAVLGGVLAWYRANQQSLLAARREVTAAKTAYYRALRSNQTGNQVQAAELEALRRSYTNATASLAAVHLLVVAEIESDLSTQERQRWAAARVNRDLPISVRYAPNLSEEQRGQVRAALDDGKQSRSDLAQAARISVSQLDEASKAVSDRRTRLELILRAEEVALPTPPELLEEQSEANAPVLEQPE